MATCYNNLGLSYRGRGDYDRAVKYCKDSLKIKQKLFPKYHQTLATSYANIANAYLMIGKHEKALENTNEEMEQIMNLYGTEDPQLAVCF